MKKQVLAVSMTAALSVLTGCAQIAQQLFPPSDWAKLVGFHDTALEVESTVVDFKNTGSGDDWSASYDLSAKGLGKVFIRTVPYVDLPDANGYGGYAPAYYEVTVNAGTATNLKWEIWNSNNQYQIHSAFGSSDIEFQKILGPFKAGEVVKLDYLKSESSDSYGYRYSPRTPLIVVYSASDLGKSYEIEVRQPKLAN